MFFHIEIVSKIYKYFLYCIIYINVRMHACLSYVILCIIYFSCSTVSLNNIFEECSSIPSIGECPQDTANVSNKCNLNVTLSL